MSGSGHVDNDTITITNNGILQITSANQLSYFNGSTIHLLNDGMIQLPNYFSNPYFTTADLVVTNGDATIAQDGGTWGSQGTVAREQWFASLTYGGDAGVLSLDPGVALGSVHIVGFSNSVFQTDATINLADVDYEFRFHEVDLAAARTVTFTNVGPGSTYAANDAGFAGSVNWDSSGSLDVRAANSLGSSTWNVLNGTMTSHVVGGLATGTVNVVSNGVIRVIDANQLARFNGATISLIDGGMIQLPTYYNNPYYSTADLVVTNGDATIAQYAGTYGSQGNAARHQIFESLTYGGDAGLLSIEPTSTLSTVHIVGFSNTVFQKDVTINMADAKYEFRMIDVDLPAGRTVTFTNVGPASFYGTPGASLAGTINWESTGYIHIRAASALGTCTVNVNTAGVTNYVDNGINGGTLNIFTNAMITCVSPGDDTTADKFIGGTIRLLGGEASIPRKWVNSYLGGTLVVAAPGCTMGVNGQNSHILTWEGLIVEADGAELDVYEQVAGGGNADMKFTNNFIRGTGTFDLQEASCDLTLENTASRFGKTFTLTSVAGADMTLSGTLSVELLGSAELVSATNYTMFDHSGASGNFTDSSTFQDAGLWRKTTPSSTIVATMTNHVDTMAVSGPAVTFAAEDAGYIAITGLTSAETYTLVLSVTANGSGVAAEMAKNPIYSNISVLSATSVQFDVVAPVTGTGYFTWDNVANSLGASVTGLAPGGGPAGTLFLIK